jgi:hypothetical protein
MPRRSALTVLVHRALAIALLCACSAPPSRPPVAFSTAFAAESDGAPLAGVTITVAGHVVGATDERGRLTVDLRGQEGEALPVSAACPAGHRASEPLPRLTLRRFRGLGDRAGGLAMTVQCPPHERQIAVVVNANGRVDVPVLIQGREVTRTNSRGVAHVALAMRPSQTFRLALDTTGHVGLRPQNPSMTFTVPDHDEVLVYDQPFEEPARPRARRIVAPAPPAELPRVPVRIDPHRAWPDRRLPRRT